jgi:hypothetical protein
MPTVSSYTEQLHVPQYLPTDYSTELEMALLQKKQSSYNTIVQRLSNLQGQALNISMLNMKGQERLGQYNKEIDQMLAGDIGDVTDPKVQSKLAGYFNKISQDTDLKKRSQLSQQYQQQLSIIESMRNSKDPTKSGYNSINETVFKKWEGGLEDFQLADSINGWESKMQRYVPFKDIDTKLVNLTKLLHAEEQLQQKPLTQKIKVKQADGTEKEVDMPTGYDVLDSTKGVSVDRIRAMMEKSLDQDELSQFEVLAKYRIISNSTPEGLANLHSSYDRWVSSETRNTEQQLMRVKGMKSQFDPSRLDPKLPPEELAIKQAQYQLQLDQLNEQELLLTTKLGQQLTNRFSQEEWMKKSPNEMLPFISQLTTESYVNGVSEALSTKNEIQKVGMDEAYFAGARIKNMQDRLTLDAELGRADIKIKEARLLHDMTKEAKAKEPIMGDPADIFKSDVSVFDSWKTVTDMTKGYNNKITPVITGKDGKGNYQINPENLVNKKWLGDNANNHEVQLWNVYVSKYRTDGAFLDDKQSKPNLAGFEAFKQQVANQDFKNDPSISQIWDQYTKDKDAGEWLTEKTAKVATTINNLPDVKNVNVGGHTLEDYARANNPNWNGEGEMTFGVRDGKGGYKQMTWTEVKEEMGKIKSAGMQNYPASITAARTGTYSPVNNYKSILDNDPGFKDLVGKRIAAEQNQSKMIQDIYLQEMPQFLQGNQSIINDKATISSYMGMINEATKLASQSSPMGLDAEDLVQISLPVGIGDKGSFMLTEAAAKDLDEQGRQLVSVGGQIIAPNARTRYIFDAPPVNQYDLMQNAMFKDKGYVNRTIGGYKVEVNDQPGRPYVTLKFTGGGKTREESVPRKDVSLIFQEAERAINQLNAQQSKPK